MCVVVSFAVSHQAVHHAFGDNRERWDDANPAAIVVRGSTNHDIGNSGDDAGGGAGSRRKPRFVLLIGDRETQQAMFVDQMQTLMAALVVIL